MDGSWFAWEMGWKKGQWLHKIKQMGDYKVQCDLMN